MAKKKVNTPVVEPTVTLKDIVEAGDSGMFTFPEVHASLIERGFVEINPAVVDGEAIATRATAAGVDFVNSGAFDAKCASVAVAPEEVKKAAPIVISSVVVGVPVPVSKARTGRTSPFNFDAMEVGASIFVPATEDRLNPWDSLASTVSAQNQKYAVSDPSGATKLNKKGETVPVKINTRTFTIRCIEDGTPWGFPGQKGAGIWRTA